MNGTTSQIIVTVKLNSEPRMSAIFAKRLQKEMIALQSKPPHGVLLENSDKLDCWTIKLDGCEGTLYAGESFTLQFTFGKGSSV
jgi:ubiquitin-protein ligase